MMAVYNKVFPAKPHPPLFLPQAVVFLQLFLSSSTILLYCFSLKTFFDLTLSLSLSLQLVFCVSNWSVSWVFRKAMDFHGWRVSAAAVIIIFCVVLALGNGVVGIIDEDLQETNRRQQHYHHNYCCRGPEERAMAMRRPFGPGSSPPTCRFRCGRCSPCIAVHVAIQPGVSRPLDYYPEAWRCRCRNKYFMP